MSSQRGECCVYVKEIVLFFSHQTFDILCFTNEFLCSLLKLTGNVEDVKQRTCMDRDSGEVKKRKEKGQDFKLLGHSRREERRNGLGKGS